ncbi:MAG TPA: response regulator [Nitrospiraceae bacterium]|jgi:CheY-like chemotaxis protein|nr:response regulator [Nitrospiraceae bacterium]
MPPKILIADDEAKWLRIVSLYLSGRNCQVTTALNGHEALQKIAEDRPDLIIADIGMPGMDGYELCSRLRRDAATRTIPFIFLTARDQDTDRLKARRVGGDDYLTKPCSLERLAQSVETAIDRIEQARKIPLDRIGLSGRIEEVDLLDLIQTLELEQKTGALVLSHGERTGTLYFQDGVIVEAEIRSPVKEEPLFRLLGWKTGRFMFIPDAVPERMPITASMANLLFQDLQTLQEHEREAEQQCAEPATVAQEQELPAVRQVLERLGRIAQRVRSQRQPGSGPLALRVLVVGAAKSGKSELIQGLVHDLSGSRWAALGSEEGKELYRIDVGRVRISPGVALHLLAVRIEKRFWSVWEQCLPGSVGAIVLIGRPHDELLGHLQAFLRAREALVPALPVQILLSGPHPADRQGRAGADELLAAELPGLDPSDIRPGLLQDQAVRLAVLDRVLDRWLAAN